MLPWTAPAATTINTGMTAIICSTLIRSSARWSLPTAHRTGMSSQSMSGICSTPCQAISKHLFFHNGAHVYMNNWQSIDFRESMNALLSQNCWATRATTNCQRSSGRTIAVSKLGRPWTPLAAKTRLSCH